jgi:His-Xaa-Ser system radical SAM maturase HxsB
MLNYFNFAAFDNDTVLITNDFGEYHFLPKEYLHALIRDAQSLPSDIQAELTEKNFLLGNNVENVISPLIHDYRESKNYLLTATSLHIFVLTNACNANCVYCQAQHANQQKRENMCVNTAKRAVDIALASPSRNLAFEFQGGEPLLNFNILRFIVDYANERKGSHIIEYNLVTNLSLLNADALNYIIEKHISVSTSLDGGKDIHDENRPMLNGDSAFDTTVKKIAELRVAGIVPGAIQTTTRASLAYPTQIIDEYVKQGFNSAFIRPLTPLGFASARWDSIGYSASKYVEFYKAALRYILDLNKSGTPFREGYAAIFLSKILRGHAMNYMELRSPCGAGIGQLAYYCDGDVYTCDEARMFGAMGNSAFRLGNVYEHSYSELIDSPTCKAACVASTLESIPGCCDCVYQPYCGLCPVVSLACNGDIFPAYAKDYHCSVFRGMIQALFEILRHNDPQEIEILQSW